MRIQVLCRCSPSSSSHVPWRELTLGQPRGGSDWPWVNHIPVVSDWFGNGNVTQFWPITHGRLQGNVPLLLRKNKTSCCLFLRVFSCLERIPGNAKAILPSAWEWTQWLRMEEHKMVRGWICNDMARLLTLPVQPPTPWELVTAVHAFPYCERLFESVSMTWNQKHPHRSNLPYSKYSLSIQLYFKAMTTGIKEPVPCDPVMHQDLEK